MGISLPQDAVICSTHVARNKPTIPDMLDSKKMGCQLCTLILDAIDEVEPGWTSQAVLTRNVLFGKSHVFWDWDGSILLEEAGEIVKEFKLMTYTEGHLFLRNAASRGVEIRYAHESGKTKEYDRPLLAESLAVSQSSSTASALTRAKAWLQSCVSNHLSCNIPDSTSMFKPTRLLDIQRLEAAGRLVLVQPSQRVEYVCLSYRWGVDAIVKTTKENFQSHMDTGINITDLAKSIQNAVTVCRGLDIRYLWVDALCIIQDDDADWLHEAGLMLEVYSGSHLTIYANQATSFAQGFLGDQLYGQQGWQRRLRTVTPPGLSVGEKGLFARFGKPEWARITPSTSLNWDGSPTSRSMAPSALDTRAWCLQEDVLPNRKLYFDGREMTWECCSRHMCECGHINFSNDAYRQLKTLANRMGEVRGWWPSNSSDQWWVNLWQRMVHDYTRREMSETQDKLAAIAGLAALVAGAIGVCRDVSISYYAGLWSRHMLLWMAWVAYRPRPALSSRNMRELKWYDIANRDANRPARSPEYRAPSWSWASNMAPVVYKGFDFGKSIPYIDRYNQAVKTRTTVDHIKCEPGYHSAQFGQARPAKAVLTGPLVSVQLIRLDQHCSDFWTLRSPRRQIDLNIESELRSSHFSAHFDPVALVRSQNRASYRVWLDFDRGAVIDNDNPSAVCWLAGACRCGRCSSLILQTGTDASTDSFGPLFCLELFTWRSGCTNDDRPGIYYPDDFYAERRKDIHRDTSHGLQTWFLLLQQSPDGTYERVGAGVCEPSADADWPMIEDRPKDYWEQEALLFSGSQKISVNIV